MNAAADAAGRLLFWGSNINSQIGKGDDDEDELVPRPLHAKRFEGKTCRAVAFGGQHSLFALEENSTVGNGASASAAAAAANGAGPSHANGARLVGMETYYYFYSCFIRFHIIISQSNDHNGCSNVISYIVW